MFRSLGRLLVFCFELVSSCFQLFATFGCSAHHHQDYQQHNNTSNNSRLNSQQQHNFISGNGKMIIDSSTIRNNHKNGHHNHHSNHCSTKLRTKSIQNGHHSIFTAKAASSSTCAIYEEPIRPKIPFYMLVTNIICHSTLILFGHLNDFLRKIGWLESFERIEKNRDGYSQLYNTFAPFYIRNIIQRMVNMWGHPICSAPSSYTEILERKFGPYNATWKLVSSLV